MPCNVIKQQFVMSVVIILINFMNLCCVISHIYVAIKQMVEYISYVARYPSKLACTYILHVSLCTNLSKDCSIGYI